MNVFIASSVCRNSVFAGSALVATALPRARASKRHNRWEGARRQALSAGAAGHGVAVALVHDRLRLRVQWCVRLLSREAQRQRGVVLFLAAAVAVAAPRSLLVAPSSASAAVADDG